MLITGNGPINELKTPAGRLFAAADALFGEALYVIVVAVLLTPIVHRLLRFVPGGDSRTRKELK